MFSRTLKTFLSSYGGFFVMAVLMTILVVVFNLPLAPSYQAADSNWYISIAQGHIENVIKPFSSSFLHPFVAGWLSSHFAINLGQAFLLVDIISLFIFFVVIGILLKKVIHWSPYLILLLPLTYYINRLGDTFSPDLFVIALTAIFFLALYYEKDVASLLVLFLLFLTRESTMLLGLVFLVVTFFRSEKRLFWTALIVVAVSVFTSSQIGNLGLPGASNLSDFVYLVIRIPFLVMQNLGLTPWVNTLAKDCIPLFTVGLPHWSWLGSIKTAGFCGFNLSVLLTTIITFLSVFGILPVTLFYLLSRKYKDIFKKAPTWLLIAMIYGVAHYFFTLGSSNGMERFTGYGWPAFLLATPFLVQIYFRINKKFIIQFLPIHLFVLWTPFLVGITSGVGIVPEAFTLIIVLALNLYALYFLKKENLKDWQSDPKNGFLEIKQA